LISFLFFAQSAIVLSCYFQRFQKFLTLFAIKTYSFFASKKSRIFDTNVQVTGNYGGRFLRPCGSLKSKLVGGLLVGDKQVLSFRPCLSCRSFSEDRTRNPVFAGSRLLEAVTKQTQFFHDQICVINIKNAEMEVKKLDKKTK